MTVIQRPKFVFLDGLRGLSALFVAMYHCQLFTGPGFTRGQLPKFAQPISAFLGLGHFSVAVFIVLSGFSLTIPIALTGSQTFSSGFRVYIQRRARRILGPYYFALVIFIVLIFAVPILQMQSGTAWDSKIPLTGGAIISHLLLIHNFSSAWILKINGPMWSVATEWQIYFFFPLLLFIWRKMNLFVSVGASFAISILLVVVFRPLMEAHPWYLGLFALGMAGAALMFDPFFQSSRIKAFLSSKAFFNSASLVFVLGMTVLVFRDPNQILSETFVGVYISILLMRMSLLELDNVPSAGKPFILRALQSRFAVFLGLFSYSIYLIHSPVLGLINLLTLGIPMNIAVRALFMMTLALPAAVAISYLFYILVEKKFALSRKKVIVTPAV